MSTVAVLSVALAAAFAAIGLITHFFGWRWTGFADKTLWDWLQLMIIPLVLAGLAFALNSFQDERDQRREENRAEQQVKRALDDKREETLRTYVRDMSDLFLQRRLGAQHPPPKTRLVARTLTLTALRQLDGVRKGVLVQFLSDSQLIASSAEAGPVVDLGGADLRDVVMNGAILLGGASFENADMRRAQFRNALIWKPDFARADLRDANFTGASIEGPALKYPTAFTEGEPGACLSGVRFVRAHLSNLMIAGAGHDVDFTGADFTNVAFQGDFTNVILHNATLTDTRVPKRFTETTVGRTDIDEECAGTRREALTLGFGG
jgi:uncharacterized protein YjbI with pentapeptide repeats